MHCAKTIRSGNKPKYYALDYVLSNTGNNISVTDELCVIQNGDYYFDRWSYSVSDQVVIRDIDRAILDERDGACDFTIAGMLMPNLTWGMQKIALGLNEVEAFVVNYGTAYNFVFTDTGFDMDYYGTMTLHFVSAE